MKNQIEIGIGNTYRADAFRAGSEAALQALSKIREFTPSLVLLFVSTELDLPGVVRGVSSVTRDCPMIGTSSLVEISQIPASGSVVAMVLASPHLSAEVGVGKGVSGDWENAIRKALPAGPSAAYFHDGTKLGRPYYFSHPSSGISPLFALLFSPGMTLTKPSLSHEIHTFLKRRTLGRIPIVGGSSSSSHPSLRNYQIANGEVYEDSVVLGVIETDLLFGVGVAHGYRPTRRRAVITRARGHVVYELDDQPAVEVCARLMGIEVEELRQTPVWFSRMPFGTADAYGQHHLLVPERILEDGSIQFAPLMESVGAITLMERDPGKTGMTTGEAVRKAIEIGNLKNPAAAVIFSCSLRHRLDQLHTDKEIEGIIELGSSIPLSGFLSFGEYGLTEEGLPIYCNQSVVALVLSSDLDKSAVHARRNADLLRHIELKLKRKVIELSAFRKINDIRLESHNSRERIKEIAQSLKTLTGAQEVTFYVGENGTQSDVPDTGSKSQKRHQVTFPLTSMGERFGHVTFSGKTKLKSIDIASAICDLVAMALHRLVMDQKTKDQEKELDLYNMARETLMANDYRTALIKISMAIQRYIGANGFSLWLLKSKSKPVREVSTFDDRNIGDVDLAVQAIESKQNQDKETPHFFLMAVPLVFNEQAKGALVLSFSKDQMYSMTRANFLRHLSMNLAAMIEINEVNKRSSLVREIHHRVKNNLQIIASLLNLQLRRLRDEAARDAMENSIRRIMSISVVHEALCEKDIGQVDASELLQTISSLVIQGMAGADQDTRVVVEGVSMLMLSSQQATNLAIVLNELLSNALKHGSRGMAQEEIRISLVEEEGNIVLSVRDNGKGLPLHFDINKNKGLGLQLISTIVENEFAGHFLLQNRDPGLEAKLIFPRDPLFVQ